MRSCNLRLPTFKEVHYSIAIVCRMPVDEPRRGIATPRWNERCCILCQRVHW